MAEKGYLMTPGPTPIPPVVQEAMAKPIVYHRGPEFGDLLARVLPRLGEVFRTSNDVAMLTGSGTAAMESAVANLCSPGDRVAVVSAGNFGERWVEIARRYRCDVAQLSYPWGETPDPVEVAARLAAVDGVRVVYCTHCETSTGVVSDVRGLAGAARSVGAISVVDAISSLGAVPLEQDEWGIDVLVSGSQKGLMTPPGLAFASVSERGLEASRQTSSPRFYLDWERTLRGQAELRPPFTPAVSLVFGLEAALDLLLSDGLETAWERARCLGRACREGVKAMGLELYSPDEDRSSVVTAVRVPAGADGVAVLRAMRERSGVTAAGGQGELKGKVVRIGHIGAVDLADVIAALAALGRAVADQGVEVDVERGLERAREEHEASHASPGARHAGAG
jgi:aspartate aminotransferase-like enzyme